MALASALGASATTVRSASPELARTSYGKTPRARSRKDTACLGEQMKIIGPLSATALTEAASRLVSSIIASKRLVFELGVPVSASIP